MMKKDGGNYEAPPRAGWLEDQLVRRELIELGVLTARLAVRAGRLRGIADDLSVGFHVGMDEPVVGTERGAGLLDGERLGREREVLEELNDLGLAEATAGRGRGRRSRGGLRGLRRLGRGLGSVMTGGVGIDGIHLDYELY